MGSTLGPLGSPFLGNYEICVYIYIHIYIRLRGKSLRFRISGFGLGSWDVAPNTTENQIKNMKNDLKDRNLQEFTGRINHHFLVIASAPPPPLMWDVAVGWVVVGVGRGIVRRF